MPAPADGWHLYGQEKASCPSATATISQPHTRAVSNAERKNPSNASQQAWSMVSWSYLVTTASIRPGPCARSGTAQYTEQELPRCAMPLRASLSGSMHDQPSNVLLHGAILQPPFRRGGTPHPQPPVPPAPSQGQSLWRSKSLKSLIWWLDPLLIEGGPSHPPLP